MDTDKTAHGMRTIRLPGERLGLRARVALAWALAAGLMVTAIGGLSYYTVRKYLVLQRNEARERQAFSNARVVRDTLRGSNPDLVKVLASLRSESGSFPLIKRDVWFGTAGPGADILPTSMLTSLASGVSGRQRFHDGSTPYLAVGIAMPSVDAQYVEVFPENTLDHTLAILRNALITSTIGGLLFGAAFGWWSAQRVLAPLRRVAEATEALAGGDLDTRLAAERDVDLNRLVTSFNAMTNAVQQRIEREARFASDVSHELRTPLGTLSAAAEVLERRRSELPERARQAVDVITGQLRRLSSMVLDLLEIARIDAGVADVNLQDTEVFGLTRFVAQSNDVPTEVLRFDRVGGSTIAPVDRRRFEQILRNLIDNANKYGDGVHAIFVQGLAKNVVVHVDDRGRGVPMEQRAQIFERFARGTETQDVPGTGLGLALAADQAELMQASVQVTDAPSGGARFSVWLPRSNEESQP